MWMEIESRVSVGQDKRQLVSMVVLEDCLWSGEFDWLDMRSQMRGMRAETWYFYVTSINYDEVRTSKV